MTKEDKKKIRWGWLIILGIVLVIVFWPNSESNSESNIDSQKSNNQEKLAPFELELANVGTSLTMYKVINRNDYPWHNVEIIVNEDYSCWSREILEPGDLITINAVTCNQFAVNYNMVESIWIEADEGAEKYSLK